MRFKFLSTVMVKDEYSITTKTAIVELGSIEEAVDMIESGKVMANKEEGFIPMAFEVVESEA